VSPVGVIWPAANSMRDDVDTAGSIRRGPGERYHANRDRFGFVCGNPNVGLPEPVPPLIKTPALPRSCASRAGPLQRSASLRQRSPVAKRSAVRVRATRCRSRVTLSSQVRHAPDIRREVWHRQRAPHRPNLQFDISHRVT
jgi:hypothetical protein